MSAPATGRAVIRTNQAHLTSGAPLRENSTHAVIPLKIHMNIKVSASGITEGSVKHKKIIAAICAAIKTIYKKLIEKIIFESLRIKICGNQSTIFKTVIFPVLGEFINAPLSSRSSAGLYSVRISFSKKSMFTALCVSILMTVSVYP